MGTLCSFCILGFQSSEPLREEVSTLSVLFGFLLGTYLRRAGWTWSLFLFWCNELSQAWVSGPFHVASGRRGTDLAPRLSELSRVLDS